MTDPLVNECGGVTRLYHTGGRFCDDRIGKRIDTNFVRRDNRVGCSFLIAHRSLQPTSLSGILLLSRLVLSAPATERRPHVPPSHPPASLALPFLIAVACLFLAATLSGISPEQSDVALASEGLAPGVAAPQAPVPSPTPETVTLGAIIDTYVDEELSGSNFGGSARLHAGMLPEFGFRQQSLVKFNLADIPADATIHSATFRAYLDEAFQLTSVNLTMGRNSATWTEYGTSWNNKPACVAKNTIAVGLSDGWKSWNALNLVNDWLSGGSANYGLCLYGPNYGASDFSIGASEAERAARRPSWRWNLPTDADTDADSDAHADADPHLDAQHHAHRHARADFDAHRHTDADVHANRDVHSYPYPHVDTEPHTPHLRPAGAVHRSEPGYLGPSLVFRPDLAQADRGARSLHRPQYRCRFALRAQRDSLARRVS